MGRSQADVMRGRLGPHGVDETHNLGVLGVASAQATGKGFVVTLKEDALPSASPSEGAGTANGGHTLEDGGGQALDCHRIVTFGSIPFMEDIVSFGRGGVPHEGAHAPVSGGVELPNDLGRGYRSEVKEHRA